MMTGILQDVRYALRQLRKSPGFTAVAVITLALGIGANTAIFSVIEAVILRPLPYRDAHHLVLLRDAQDEENGGFLYRDYEKLKLQSHTVEDSAVYYRDSGFSRVTLTGASAPEFVQGAFVSANFFPLLGVAPELGRAFTPQEEAARAHLVILSHGLWIRKFGASQNIIGTVLQINGINSQIIGVMPEAFQFPASDQQFWAPLTTNPYWGDPALTTIDPVRAKGFYARWQIISRLKSGVNIEQAQAEINVLFNRFEQAEHDSSRAIGVKGEPLRVNLNGNTRLALIVLFVAVVFVLLIAYANITNLMLARGTARQAEMAVRVSLGAGHARLLRQLFTEIIILASISGTVGLLLGYFGLHLALGWAPSAIPRLGETSLDARVYLFTLTIALFTAVLSGLVPAWRISRTASSQHSRGHGTKGKLKPTRSFLIAAEFALTVVLLTGAGLLVRSFLGLESVDLGFDPARVFTVNIVPSKGSVASKNDFYNLASERLRVIPGGQAVGAIDGLFETGKLYNLGLRSIEGRPSEPKKQWTPLQWNSVRGDFFTVMGIQLLKGRNFTSEDNANAPLVALIDEDMARRYWPNENPLGMRFKGQDQRGKNDDWITVIGVVGNTRRNGLERNTIPHVYEPYTQGLDGDRTPDFVVRLTSVSPGISSELRSVVRQLDPQAVVSPATSLDQQLSSQLSPRRFQTFLLALFSLAALLLASVGVYGVLNYSVAQRTHEIGIRMALGARRGDVLRLVILEGTAFALGGTALGIICAAGLTKFMSSLLFHVTATDPATFGAVTMLLIMVAVAGCYIPARRAAKVDPMVALRYE